MSVYIQINTYIYIHTPIYSYIHIYVYVYTYVCKVVASDINPSSCVEVMARISSSDSVHI